jgi:Zn-dependent protease with chaperone function
MDFFAAQDLARTRTRRLVVLFGLAVLAIITSTSVLAFVALEHERFFPIDGEAPATTEAWGRVFLEHLDVFGLIAAGTLAIVGFSSLFKWAQVRGGGHVVAEMMGGRLIDPRTTDPFERRLMNVVEEMAIASGIPLPAVYLMPEEASINAFAAGLTTSDAVVAVTQGCLEKLSRDELQGVVAHEIGHVLNGDMKLNVQLIAILHGILIFAILGRIIIRTAFYSSGSRRSSRNNGGGVIAMVAAGVALVVIGYAGFFFGRLIQAAVSRQREYLADASAVQFTRNPRGIAGALSKIGGYSRGSKMSHPRSTEVSHALFAQGFRSSFIGLLATHPPLPDRIRAVDPSWSGEFAEAPERDAALREIRADAKARPHASAQSLGSRVAVGGDRGPRAATVGAMMAFSPERAVAEVGAITEANVSRARALRDAIPEPLLDAAHDEEAAPALVYGLLLARDDARMRDGQLALLSRDADAVAVKAVKPLLPHLPNLDPAHRLPLIQIALPTMRSLTGPALDRFFDVIHSLVHYDGHVDAFEFALQKMLVHHLRLAAHPTSAKVNLRSLPEVAREVSMLLSVLAHLAESEDDVARSFAAGVARLPTIAHQLRLAPKPEGFDAIHDALETLDHTSLGIRKKVIDAAAHTIGADGSITLEEADLLRAISSVLDCPMPPL